MVYNPFPAVVIGGPPHSGKSVLAYSLTRALRGRDVPHYLLRAYPPDYEGDWFHEGDQDVVRHLRLKGARSQKWLLLLRRDVARRHLPLIVDIGGLPTPEQETVLDECTHGILLTPFETARQEWMERFAAHGLVLLADLRSDLHGENHLEETDPVLRGTLAGLERGKVATGPAFEALVARLAGLFRPATINIHRRHQEMAPTELVVDLDRLARSLGRDPTQWEPTDLPAVLEYLPAGEPLALYGRGPNWLYAAVAIHALPAPFYLFDVRLGWVEPPAIVEGTPSPDGSLTANLRPLGAAPAQVVEIDFRLPDAYLDITEAEGMPAPVCPSCGVVLSGKLPLWLWAALARFYAPRVSWLAVIQPQLSARWGGRAVTVYSREGPPVGSIQLTAQI